MKTFNTKFAEYMKQKGFTKKDFAEVIGHDIQSIVYFSSENNPRNPTYAFLMKWLKFDPDLDLNYFLKNELESPRNLVKVISNDSVNENSEMYSINSVELLTEIKEQNNKILSLLTQ